MRLSARNSSHTKIGRTQPAHLRYVHWKTRGTQCRVYTRIRFFFSTPLHKLGCGWSAMIHPSPILGCAREAILPQIQSLPSAVTHIDEAGPHETATTRRSRKASTRTQYANSARAALLVTVSALPAVLPQPYSTPLDVTAKTCSVPSATSITCSPSPYALDVEREMHVKHLARLKQSNAGPT